MKQEQKEARKTRFKWVLFFIGAILAVTIFEGYGALGLIVYLLAMTGYQIFKGKDFIILAMKNAEIKLFGKPLDKELWEKGELKHLKVKIKWKKKKENKNAL